MFDASVTIADTSASDIQSLSTGEAAEDMQIYRLLARCLGAGLSGSLVSTVIMACDKAITHLIAPLKSLMGQKRSSSYNELCMSING